MEEKNEEKKIKKLIDIDAKKRKIESKLYTKQTKQTKREKWLNYLEKISFLETKISVELYIITNIIS